MFQQHLVLRWALAIILFMHSIPGMFNGGIHDFGDLYLNQVGFDPFGVYLAWVIKLSHVVAAILFIANKYIKWAAWPTLFILVVGIFMVHLEHGWFVVTGYNQRWNQTRRTKALKWKSPNETINDAYIKALALAEMPKQMQTKPIKIQTQKNKVRG